jgi:lipopolysaccharide/colanic/teichoic acid biosynthesis glycosyltransferase
MQLYRQYGKRIFDLMAAGCAMIVAFPLMLFLWLGVILCLGRPALFYQLRPGRNGHPFLLFKFRTMREARDDHGHPLPDEERLTKFGRFLRSTSLDELPELFNVLKGDMSLVGPRPLLMRYLARYTPQQARRHDVKPGLTGWAQVNGRNAATWDQKFALDVWYVDQLSLWLDVKIMFLTLWQIILRKGINQPGHATMPEFMGNGRKEG